MIPCVDKLSEWWKMGVEEREVTIPAVRVALQTGFADRFQE